MFTENNSIKYKLSLADDVSNLYLDYKAGKLSLLDASTKYKELKDYCQMLVVRGDMQPNDYKSCFVECPTFNDFRAFMEADRWEV